MWKEKGIWTSEDFDDELFKAVDDYMWNQKDQLDTDPDTDLEKADLLDVEANSSMLPLRFNMQ